MKKKIVNYIIIGIIFVVLVWLIIEKYTDTSIHSIRKLYAQEEFDRLRKEGLEIKQALGEVSVLLGHSDNRFELMKEYVLDTK